MSKFIKYLIKVMKTVYKYLNIACESVIILIVDSITKFLGGEAYEVVFS